MFDANFSFINEEFHAASVSPRQLDMLLADGWRHFGTHFYKYNLGFYEPDTRLVMPLRIRLADFSLSKSQRRATRRNSDLEITIGTVDVDRKTHELFHRHKQRFNDDVPRSVGDFLGTGPSPVDTREMRLYAGGELCAISYFDVGETMVSGVYAMFEPADSRRSLGIFTLLREIEFAIENGKEFYYLGYAYAGSSFYDYKKRFRGTEMFDWSGKWLPYAEPV